ncbi:MAG: transporter substrate-binding domain-containing protein [Caldilineaceae bacterium]
MTTITTLLRSVFLLTIVLVVTACGTRAQPTATPASEPTAAPVDVWQQVQASGTLVVGTSVDYPPFEYYNQNFSIDGFDVALMRAIGDELGVKVEFKDIAFDGLAAALAVNQIDAAIAAISVTPAREQAVDFSQVYYVSEDAVLATNASMPAIRAYADLANFTIGVQKGSVYAEIVKDELITPGLMRPANLFTYNTIERAVADLQQGLVSLVLLDLGPAQSFAQQEKVVLVGQGLTRERYAVALPKGAATLQAKINEALDALRNRGAIAPLVQRYLDLAQNEIQPLPTVAPPTAVPTAAAPATAARTSAPTMAPTSAPIVAPTAAPTAAPPQPGACTDAMVYVADLTYDDLNMTQPPVFTPGQPFRKGWRVRNSGSCTWNSSYSVTFVDGNAPAASMGGRATAINGPVPPGATYDLYVDLVAPLTPGVYQGTWQLRNGQGAAFGERVWVGISVPGRPGPTAAPTQTPSPDLNFTVDRNNIRTGDCVVFQWNVSNVREIYFYAEGQNWQNNGVAGQDTRRVCLDRTTNYYLRVVRQDNNTEIRQITLNVQATNAPNIARFTVGPAQIPAGQCANLQWEVQGNVQRVKLLRNNQVFWDDAPLSGNTNDCPSGSGGVDYTLEASGPGGTNRASNHIDVVAQQATATPVPTSAPAPVVNAFAVNPTQITAGQCVSLAWSTSGGVDWIRLSRNGAVVLDNGPVNSNGLQDCLEQAGATTYVLEAHNQNGQSAVAQANVEVVAPEQPTPTPQPQAPVINSFVVDRNTITFGECVNLSWQFGGDSLALAQLFRNDEVIAGDVPLAGSQQDCPPAPGNVAYQLKIDSEYGGIAQQFQYVTVEDTADSGAGAGQLPETPPVIESFTADTTQINVGGCVNLAWSFSGTSLVGARLLRNDAELALDVTAPGSYQDCIADDSLVGTVTYRLVVDSEFAGSSAAEQAITVVGG